MVLLELFAIVGGSVGVGVGVVIASLLVASVVVA